MPPLPRSSRRTDALPSGNILTSTSRLMPRWPLLVSPTPIQYSSWLISVGNSTLATALRPPVELLKQHTKHRTTELGSQTPGSHHGRVQHRQRQQLAGRSTAALGVDHPGTAQGSQTTGDPRGPVQHQRPRRGRPGVSAVPRGVSHRATTRCNRITGDPRGPVQHQRPRRGRPGGLAMARGVSHRATKWNHHLRRPRPRARRHRRPRPRARRHRRPRPRADRHRRPRLRQLDHHRPRRPPGGPLTIVCQGQRGRQPTTPPPRRHQKPLPPIQQRRQRPTGETVALVTRVAT